MKFVEKLSPEEVITLKELTKFGPCYRYRQRAHMILLSNKDYMINEIADIFQINRDQVSTIIDRWRVAGLIGLRDLTGKGRKTKINESDRHKIISWVDENVPRSTKEILRFVKEELDLDVREGAIQKILKDAGYSWKRLRKAVKHLRDQEAFDATKTEISELEKNMKTAKLICNILMAAGFHSHPQYPMPGKKRGDTKVVTLRS